MKIIKYSTMNQDEIYKLINDVYIEGFQAPEFYKKLEMDEMDITLAESN